MIGAMFVNNGSNVDVYEVIVDTSKIKKIQKCIDNYYDKGEKIEKQTSSLNLICGRDFFGNKVEIISKKYVGKKLVVNLDFCSDDEYYVKVYKYKYYAYKQHKLSMLCDSLLNSNGTVDLSCNIRDILDYVCKTSVEHNFLKDILNTIKNKKIDKKTFLIKLRNMINKINIKNKNLNFEINFNNETNNIIDRAKRFNKILYQVDSSEDTYKNNLALGLTTKNKILMLLPTTEIVNEKFKF